MNLTYNKWDGDGVRVAYPIEFPLGYLTRDDVYVYVGEWGDYQTQLDYTWISPTTIELTTPVPVGVEFTIRRVVPRADLKYYFERTPIIGGYLDNEHLQLLMILQEIADGFLNVNGSLPNTGDLDMRGYKIYNLKDADVNFGDHAVNVRTLRNMLEGQEVGGGSIISDVPPPSTVKATRWWRCTDGRSFVRTQNSTGYGQWVEERAPTNPPNYEITQLHTAASIVTVTAELHNHLVVLGADTVVLQVGRAVTAQGNYRPGTMVFFTHTGNATCQFVVDAGVTILGSATLEFAATNSTAALIAMSETEWLLVGDMKREVT